MVGRFVLGRLFVGIWHGRLVHRLTYGEFASMQSGRRLLGDLQSIRIDLAGQRHVGRLRQDHASFGIVEAADQTKLSLRSADLVPGQPEAVGRPQIRLALMAGQSVAGKNEFFLWCGIIRIRILVVERVNR